MRKETVLSLLNGIMEKQNEAIKEKKFDNYEDARMAYLQDMYKCGVRDALRQAILLIEDMEQDRD